MWLCREGEFETHIIPEADFDEHKEAYDCWCQPVSLGLDSEGLPVYTHNCAMENPN